ncbi:MAG: hypothetical protein NXH97_03245 [Rhodobacteraceae bacterium]|nr:hypothetical protein [Paracoccaceae bacterium]
MALDPIHPAGLALLDAWQDIELIHLTEPPDDSIAERLRDAEILVLRGRRLVPKQFGTVKSIRLVTRGGVDNDILDFAQMGRNGLTVSVSADANYVSIADRAVSDGDGTVATASAPAMYGTMMCPSSVLASSGKSLLSVPSCLERAFHSTVRFCRRALTCPARYDAKMIWRRLCPMPISPACICPAPSKPRT